MQGAALVTGAGRRIGRAMAVALAREGLDLAVHYNLSRADAESAAEEVRALGRRCEVFQCDLTGLLVTPKVMPRGPGQHPHRHDGNDRHDHSKAGGPPT